MTKEAVEKAIAAFAKACSHCRPEDSVFEVCRNDPWFTEFYVPSEAVAVLIEAACAHVGLDPLKVGVRE